MNLKALIPWQARIAAKVVLSRIPVRYALWKTFGLFEHGQMENPGYAYQVFKAHYERVKPIIGDRPFVVLELGPGDTLYSALVARAFGAKRCYLVDSGAYADLRPRGYSVMTEELRKMGYDVPSPALDRSIGSYLETINACYLVEGVNSLKQLNSRSVDFIWSQAVLEHIKKHDFETTLKELRRVLRDDGASSHRVDLTDHLGGKLNNLRFSSRVWESQFMSASGFYTNRIRYGELMTSFASAGFDAQVCHIDKWQQLPTPKEKLSGEFRHLYDEDLLVSGFDVLLLPIKS